MDFNNFRFNSDWYIMLLFVLQVLEDFQKAEYSNYYYSLKSFFLVGAQWSNYDVSGDSTSYGNNPMVVLVHQPNIL